MKEVICAMLLSLSCVLPQNSSRNKVSEETFSKLASHKIKQEVK